ncbi:MAG: substrate-binding domain-containing protein [Lysobacterales bacterium]
MIARLPLLTALLIAAAAGTAGAQTTLALRGDSVSLRALGRDSAALSQQGANIRLQWQELSTVSAIEAVAAGTADVALSSRGQHALNPKEAGLVFEPLAWDGIVAIVHPGNPVSGVSLRDLRDIYAGRIKTWDQIGGRAQPIHLNVVAGPLDGIEYGLRRALFGRGQAAVAAERWYLNTEQLEASIAIDPNGLAVSALSSAAANPKVKRLQLEGVSASPATVLSLEYLLVTPLYLVHRAGAESDPAIAGFRALLQTPAFVARAMTAHRLLPVGAAAPLNEAFAMREQKLLALLDSAPPAAASAVTAIASTAAKDLPAAEAKIPASAGQPAVVEVDASAGQ